MAKDAPIINILTYHLPHNLANQIYNEYQNRLREANLIIENIKSYKTLQNDKKTVELLLALSIFHKRIITNLDAAVKFYGTVTKYSTADTIKIGRYDLTGKEKNPADVVEKLFGCPASPEDWESRIFPARLPGYTQVILPVLFLPSLSLLK